VDRITGLDLGADDYVAKPCSPLVVLPDFEHLAYEDVVLSSMPSHRCRSQMAVLSGADPCLRMTRSRVSLLTGSMSRWENRAAGRPPRARSRWWTSCSSRTVRRA
jgi:DNA-binding response OmpR family regulator